MAFGVLILLCVLCSFPLLSQESTRTVWDGVFNEDQAKRGSSIFIDECSVCHGRDLEGADMTPALTGAGFMSNWDGLTIGDLVDRIRTTMPLNRPGALTRQQNADVVAYILRVNQFPAGKDELPRDAQSQKQIVFKAVRP